MTESAIREAKPNCANCDTPRALHAGLLVLCGLFGALLSTWPHLAGWLQHGEPLWLADYDEISIYLPLGSHAYRQHPAYLSDPTVAEETSTCFTSFPVIPGVLLAHALGIPVIYLGLVWRAIGGLLVGSMGYLLFQSLLQRRWLALLATLWFLCDGGIVQGQVLYVHAKNLVTLLTVPGELGEGQPPQFFPHWRIFNPSLTLPWWLLFLWLTVRAVDKPTSWRVGLAGAAFGLLFYDYFFYWTAGGLGLLLAICLDRKNARTYFLIGLTGTLLGLPAMWSNYQYTRTFATDWMNRTQKFVPIPRFHDILLPRLTIALMALSGCIIFRAQRDLRVLWCLALAGLLLINHQVLTARDVENYHWNYALGPTLAIVCIVILMRWFGLLLSPWVGTVLGVVFLGILVVPAFSLRQAEASRWGQSQMLLKDLRLYRQQTSSYSHPCQPGSVIAGHRHYVEFAMVLEGLRPLDSFALLYSARMSDPEWNERVALNAFTRGLTRSGFIADQERWSQRNIWGNWVHDESKLHRLLGDRLAAYDRIAGEPTAYWNRFGVRYVALIRGTPTQHLGPDWVQVASGPTWEVWERRATAP